MRGCYATMRKLAKFPSGKALRAFPEDFPERISDIGHANRLTIS